MKSNTSNILNLCLMSLFTAVTAIMAQISIPMPFGVPLTMQTFAITLSGILLGSKKATTTTIIYMLLGAVGLPVFANMTGGWQSFVSPASGFLLSFPLMAYIIGYFFETQKKSLHILGLFLGNIANFICGLFMFCVLTGSSIPVGITTCVLPFLPATIIKAVLAYWIGLHLKHRLHVFL